MRKVKREGIKQRKVVQKETSSKFKYLRFLIAWVPWAYGVLMLLTQGVTSGLDFFDSIFPRITVEAKADPAFLHDVEFTFKNDGRVASRDVVLGTVLIWHEAEDGGLVLPYAPDEHTPEERVLLKDRYSFLGEIPRHGGTATANLPEDAKQINARAGTKRIGICQELSFQMFPLSWFARWFPITKLTWNVGYMIDKPAGVHTWRKVSCDALQRNMPDRKYYGSR